MFTTIKGGVLARLSYKIEKIWKKMALLHILYDTPT